MESVNVKICCCAKCTMMGSIEIMDNVDDLKASFNNAEFSVELLSSTEECKENSSNSPVVIVNSKTLKKATPQMVMEEILGVLR